MYEYLQGRLVEAHPARVVVDVGGVGYAVAVPVGARFEAGAERGVKVFTHLIVREDLHTLYGFPDPGQRAVFRLLLSVRGVGPGLALGVLSSLPGEQLLDAVAGEDLVALTSVKGVGKKTAEQILLDLRDKAQSARAARANESSGTPQAHVVGTDAIADAVQALTSIGYSAKEAQKGVERAARKVDPADLELLVRTALRP